MEMIVRSGIDAKRLKLVVKAKIIQCLRTLS